MGARTWVLEMKAGLRDRPRMILMAALPMLRKKTSTFPRTTQPGAHSPPGRSARAWPSTLRCRTLL